jgi:hypothetical protein
MGQLNQAIKIKNVIDFYGINSFVETGTGNAEVVRDVSSIKGDLDTHTIEIIEPLYNRNMTSYGYLKNVNWHLGSSIDVLPKIIPDLKTNTLFWMDAHFPGADFGFASYEDEKDYDKRLPLKKELETILKYKDIKNDVFVIDDLWIYEEGPYEGGNWDKRSTCGADNIDFVNDLFEDTHYIIKSYAAQGFIILFPLSFDITSDIQNLVVGEIS